MMMTMMDVAMKDEDDEQARCTSQRRSTLMSAAFARASAIGLPSPASYFSSQPWCQRSHHSHERKSVLQVGTSLWQWQWRVSTWTTKSRSVMTPRETQERRSTAVDATSAANHGCRSSAEADEVGGTVKAYVTIAADTRCAAVWITVSDRYAGIRGSELTTSPTSGAAANTTSCMRTQERERERERVRVSGRRRE